MINSRLAEQSKMCGEIDQSESRRLFSGQINFLIVQIETFYFKDRYYPCLSGVINLVDSKVTMLELLPHTVVTIFFSLALDTTKVKLFHCRFFTEKHTAGRCNVLERHE